MSGLVTIFSVLFHVDPGDRRWVGMWWGGFLLCGLLLIIVAIPFFLFPKVLTHEKKKLKKLEPACKPVAPNNSNSLSRQQSQEKVHPPKSTSTKNLDSGYGKDIKDIPLSMWRLVSNPVYIVTCLGACMELMIVSGFIVFLPKYLETQFSLGKSQASVFTGERRHCVAQPADLNFFFFFDNCNRFDRSPWSVYWHLCWRLFSETISVTTTRCRFVCSRLEHNLFVLLCIAVLFGM